MNRIWMTTLRMYRHLPDALLHRLYQAVYRRAETLPELVISGISRSGTSYLCRLLHSVRDIVIINQPVAVHQALKGHRVPWLLPIYFSTVRRRLLAGKPIDNPRRDGALVDDTAKGQQRTWYVPAVSRADFMLGIKNVRAVLGRLPDITKVMPNAMLVACIRDPYDTVDSWKRSFPHLANPDLRRDAAGDLEDPCITTSQRTELKEVASAQSLAEKRALYWRYLANRIHDHREKLTLVQYEDFVTNPAPVISLILGRFGWHLEEGDRSQLPAGKPRGMRTTLDGADLDAIRSICLPVAERLGVEVRK